MKHATSVVNPPQAKIGDNETSVARIKFHPIHL